MKRPLKFLLVAVALVAGLFVLAAVVLPFVIDGERLKPQAESKLTQTLGRTVTLGPTRVSLWTGLALRSESLRVGEPTAGPAAGSAILEAGRTEVHVAFLPLLKKEVEARSITVSSARIVQDGKTLASGIDLESALRLAADGSLTAAGKVSGEVDLLAPRPRARATFSVGLAGGTLAVRPLTATVGPLRLDATGRVEGIGAAAPRAKLDVSLRLPKSNAHGKFDVVLDAARPTLDFDVVAPLLDLDEVLSTGGTMGLAMTAPGVGAGFVPAAAAAEPPPGEGDFVALLRGRGTLAAERCVYRGIEMTGVSAKMTLERGAVHLGDTRLTMFGGTARGTIDARPFEAARPFSLDQQADGVAIGAMIATLAPSEKGTVEGTAALTLTMSGRGGEPALLPTLDGKGQVSVTGGKIASFGMIQQVMKLLEVAGAKGFAKDETPFDSLAAHFDLAKGVATTHDLAFRSADLDLDGGGTVGLGGAIHLDVTGSFSKPVSDQLIAKTPQLDIRRGADGRLTVPLQVRGTMTAPKVQLDLEKVLHEGLKKEIEKEGKKRLLDKLLGR